MHLEYGDLATWFGSVGVVGALFRALYQIRTERRERLQQSRDALQRQRREQAEHVSAWPGAESLPRTPVILLNRSDEPVYEVVATLVMVQGGPHRKGEDKPPRRYISTLAVLPPSRWRTTVAGGWAGMSARPGIEVAFIDRSGVSWIRRATGSLEEIMQLPIDYYGLGRPAELGIPELDGASDPKNGD